MQVRTNQQTGGTPASSAIEPGTTSVAPGRRRAASLVITAVAGGAALLILAVTFWSRGEPTLRTNHPAASPAGVSNADATGSVRVHEALGWVDGLAAGLILPSDVTARFEAQDPRMAKAVTAAWSDLNSSGGSVRLHEAMRWVDGLAAGLILPSDVTARFEAQDPRMAKGVLAAWSDLNARS